jgi:hypothetical protein
MKKYLNISQILVYYDFPQIFVAYDNVKTYYLCLLSSINNDKTTFISTAISNQRLNNFINGSIDLRDIFESPELNQWFYFDSIDEPILAEEWMHSTLPEEFLPERGFIYEKIQNEDVIINEVIEKNNVVVHLAVSDSENNNSINIEFLSDVSKLYQSTIEYIYKKTLVHRKLNDNKNFQLPINYNLRAFAASPGSFNLHLYSTSNIDLFGKANIEFGLEKFDEILKEYIDEDVFIQSLRSVKGHSLNSLKKLVKKLLDNDIILKHKWVTTNLDEVHFSYIDKDKAEKIYSILNLSKELTEEIKSFKGFFTQVDVKRGTWRLFCIIDDKEYNGESYGDILKGVTVDSVIYNIKCSEIIEELKVTEKDKTKYILKILDIDN